MSEEDQFVVDDKLKKEVFDKVASLEKESVSSKEIKDGFDCSSFDNMPFLFNGLQTNTFGLSSNKQKNPFFQIKKIAMDKSKSWDDRTQAIRYMQKIPHIHRESNCIEATICIISDKQYKFDDRYFFFSNNEKIIKLDYDIVNACHKYVYENFDKLSDNKIPILYKILSAQYALTQFPVDSYDITGVQHFLASIAKDKDIEINYRAECADILDRTGYGEFKTLGRQIIEELGDLYNENKKRTIYTNLQNVHDTTITKKVIDTLRQLMSTVVVKQERNSGEIYERIVELTKDDDRRENIINSFQRVLIDTAKFEGLSMVDILLLVWEKICSSDNKIELEKRLLDEFHEMDKTCSSGHLSRIINVLSGFFDDIQPVRISYSEQLRTNVFARYTAAMRTLGQHEQDAIVQEMTMDDKPTIEDFIFSYSPKNELQEEFVPTYISQDEFNEIFNKAEREFFGYKEKKSIPREGGSGDDSGFSLWN